MEIATSYVWPQMGDGLRLIAMQLLMHGVMSGVVLDMIVLAVADRPTSNVK